MANEGQSSVAAPAPVLDNPFRGRAQVVPLPPEPEVIAEVETPDLEADEVEEDVEETPSPSQPQSLRQVITDDELRQKPQRLNELRPKERLDAHLRIVQAERDAAQAAIAAARAEAYTQAMQDAQIAASVEQINRLQQEDPQAWADFMAVPAQRQAFNQAEALLAQRNRPPEPVNHAKWANKGAAKVAQEFGANPQAIEMLAARGQFPATEDGYAALVDAIADIKLELRSPVRTAAAERQAAAAGLNGVPKAVIGTRGNGNEPLTFEALQKMSQTEMNALLDTPDGEKRIKAALAKAK